MGLPDKATRHIPKPQEPIGSQKKGKIKVLDGDTQKVRWRQGKKGFIRDYDGDPIAQNHTARNAEIKNTHSPRMGYKRKTHKPHMGDRDGAYEDE